MVELIEYLMEITDLVLQCSNMQYLTKLILMLDIKYMFLCSMAYVVCSNCKVYSFSFSDNLAGACTN